MSRAPVFQVGPAVPGSLAKFASNGMASDVGDTTGDANAVGANPFAVSDRKDLGVALVSDLTNGPYCALGVGHRSNGDGVISLDSYNGEPEHNLYFRINGEYFPFLPDEIAFHDILRVGTREEIKLLDTSLYRYAWLREPGREGVFRWDAALSVSVHSVDTQEGVYIAPNPLVDGAWVRAHNGVFQASWFGAVGDAVALDTLAIEGIFAVVRSFTDVGTHVDTVNISQWDKAGIPAVEFGPGEFVYTGSGILPPRAVSIRGAGPNNTCIRIDSGGYLFLLAGADTPRGSLHFSDIKFKGGKGVLRITGEFASQQVGQAGTRFSNCYFLGYSECAVGSLWRDDPYWMFEDVHFIGTATSIGIFLPDGIAQTVITGCSFLRNKYHIKTGLRRQAHYNIGPNNSFFRAAEGETVADIWFVASPEEDDQNIGDGVGVIYNRFSSENLLEGDMRIIIADEDLGSGDDGMTRSHSTNLSTGRYRGVRFIGNSAVGFGTPDTGPNNKGFIYSYMADLGRLFFRDNRLFGWFPYIVEFAPGITESAYGEGSQSVYELHHNGSIANMPVAFSNLLGFGRIISPDGAFLGRREGYVTSGYDPAAMNILTESTPAALLRGADVAATVVTDHLGFDAAAEFTFLDPEFGDSTVYLELDEAELVNGSNLWVQFYLKRAATDTMGMVRFDYGDASGRRIASWDLPLHPTYQRVQIPVSIVNNTNPLWFRFTADWWANSNKNRFVLSRPYVSQSSVLPNTGPVHTTESNWNGGHLIMGNYHFWVDGTGALRIKNGRPTSGTDGTIVGTQA